jgi:hypothetical protein
MNTSTSLNPSLSLKGRACPDLSGGRGMGSKNIKKYLHRVNLKLFFSQFQYIIIFNDRSDPERVFILFIK